MRERTGFATVAGLGLPRLMCPKGAGVIRAR